VSLMQKIFCFALSCSSSSTVTGVICLIRRTVLHICFKVLLVQLVLCVLSSAKEVFRDVASLIVIPLFSSFFVFI
jgi:hypothetical protein